MKMRKLSIILAMLAVLLGLSVTPALAASSDPTPTPPPPTDKTVHANEWTFGTNGAIIGTSKSGATPNADYGICKGSFGGPGNVDNTVATNVYIQCTSPAAVSGGIELEECVRIGGPDDFFCTNASMTSGSTTGNAYYLNISTRIAPCQPGEYRPKAYNLQVNGIEYPDVEGNVVSVTC